MARKRKYGTLGGTLDEMKSGQFLGNARVRSSGRKSPWNLLLLLALPLWIFLFLEGLKLARFLATAARHGQKPLLEDLIWPGSIAPFFVYFPLLIATMVLAMVLITMRSTYSYHQPGARWMPKTKRFPEPNMQPSNHCWCASPYSRCLPRSRFPSSVACSLRCESITARQIHYRLSTRPAISSRPPIE
jgi:hypothetical protein